MNILKIGCATLALAASTAAIAQVAPKYEYDKWRKICLDAPAVACSTASSVRGDKFAPVVDILAIEPRNGAPNFLRVVLYDDLMGKSPVRVSIDQQAPIVLTNVNCGPQACAADHPLTAANIAALSAAKELTVQATDKARKPVSIPVPMTDFSSQFASKGTAMSEILAQQKKAQQELQEKAKAARERVLRDNK